LNDAGRRESMGSAARARAHPEAAREIAEKLILLLPEAA
jgi:UDP-N-acetylglucosamine:LPS N-acetylglucosamine transferase